MANRKVLINRHSTKQQAPVASEMFHGEIAISHPSEVSATTIYTRNGDVMVPFISCAQTISIIDSKVKASEDSVVAKAGELHLEVESAGTPDATIWQISSKDIQSKEEFKAYSAATQAEFYAYSAATDTRIETVADALDSLLDISVTGITGDSIITATLVEPATGSNAYNLTHKQALATDGFNKLATDAYGHVTGSTSVATSDIEALGFKTSAATEDEIEAAIEALGAVSASTGKYFTAIGVNNGVLVKEEADLPTLEIESAGTGNVVSQIKVEGHKISYSATSVATSEDIQELSAATGSFSAATFNEFASAFTAINNLSADTEAADDKVFTSAKTYADELIAALDSETAVTAGKYLTGIAIADGKISGITEADLPELSKVVSGAGNVFTDIEVNDHEIVINKGLTVASDADLKAVSGIVDTFSAATVAEFTELSAYTKDVDDKVKALSAATENIEGRVDNIESNMLTGISFNGSAAQVANNVASINETQLSLGTETGDGNVVTSIAVDDHQITLTKGITALTAVTATGDSYVAASVAGNSAITVTTNAVADKTALGNVAATGSLVDAKAVKDYVEDIVSSGVNYKGATSNLPSTAKTGDLYIADAQFTIGTETVEVGDFIIYDGTKWDIIEKNDTGAITGNLTADTITLGAGLNEAKSLANGSAGQVLTMVNGAPAWANDPELTVVSAGTGNVVSDITVNDHEITFTKGVTAANDADLQALSGVVEDFSGATDAKFIELSAGTIQLSADTKAAINQLSGFAHNSMIARDDAVFSSAKTYADEKVAAEIALLDSVGSASTTGHYLTSVTITDGKISAVGEKELPAATPVTTVNGTTGDTAAAVLAGVVTGGTEGHQLTLNYSNKVFSASTSESAVTSQSAITSLSAQTSVSANMAYELSSAATISSGQVRDLENVIKSIKVNSATTAESADTAASADKVANALSVSGYSDSSASTLDTAIAYDGSAARSLTFGTNGNAGLKSMSMTSAGVVDVEVIDCGEY